jgi:hypothetical protein
LNEERTMVDVQLQTEIVLETDDRVGVVAEVSRVLADMGINVISIVVHRSGEAARVHLITSCQSHAFEALRDAGFSVEERRVILMEIPHHPGFLSRMSEALARKGISIEELHATVSDDSPTGVVVFRCSNDANAVQLLRGR